MRFMVPFRMSGPREEILALVPAERARVAELRDAGIVEALYLAAAGDGWIVMAGASEADVRASIASLPMAHLIEVDLIALRDA